MRLARYQPDPAGNVGAILRTAACFGVPVDIILPCGFAWSDRALRRAGMDYAERAEVTAHVDWGAFLACLPGRLILLTTKGGDRIDRTGFLRDDTLLMGSESTGAPPHVHVRADLAVRIPQAPGTRSLNISVAAGIALAEALRQIGGWPE